MKLSPIASVVIAVTSLPSFNGYSAEAAEQQEIENIVVTGQKIDRTLQETPNSVAVVTASAIEESSIRNITDVFTLVPNISGNLNEGFRVRGIDAFNVSGGGNSYLTSMYYDGAPMPYRLVRMGSLSMWDISQVEVFRGPQSTIQGRNALAGAIVIRSQQPTYEWSGKTQLVMGNHGRQEFAIAGGGALIEDQLAFRISGESKDFDGYNYNVTRNEHSDYIESDNYRAKFLFEPKAIEGLTALLSFSHDETETGARWAQTDRANGERHVFFDSPILEYVDSDVTNLEITYEINDNWFMDSITTHSDVKYGYLWDGDVTAENIAELNYGRTDKTFSQEFRFTFEYDKLKGVVGLYYSDLDVSDQSGGRRSISLTALGVPALLTAPTEFGGLGLPQALADQVLAIYAPADPVRLGTTTALEQNVKSRAVFADLTYQITDSVDLIAGFRYDKETQENASDSLYTVDNADQLPDPAFYAQVDPLLGQLVAGLNANLYAQAANASGTAPLSDADFDAFLPKLGVSYRYNEDVTLSAIYQKGYRSGGVGTNIARAEVFTYDPEYTDNIELSLRSVLMDGKLVFNANAFFLDWEDQQVQVQLSSNQYDTQTINSGKSEVKGLELELFYFPSSQMKITGGVGYADTGFTDFQYQVGNETVDLTGRQFADAPEYTANVAVSYDFNNGFYINANANYQNDSLAYLNPETVLNGFQSGVDPEPKNDARTLINLQLGYEFENYKAFIDVKNLLGEEYISQFSYLANNESGLPQMVLGEERQISLTLQASF